MKKRPHPKQSRELPLLAVSMGDPAGVGPELCLRMLADPGIASECRLLVFGSGIILERVARCAGIGFSAAVAGKDAAGGPESGSGHVVADCGIDPSGIEPGCVSAAGGRMAAECIRLAVQAVIARDAAAVVTAPVSKEALAKPGIRYPGHTEMLADITKSNKICMTLASDDLVVSLVTAHVPLRDVSSYLTARRVLDVIELTHAAMFSLHGRRPRIAVCGLNPHAGESGLLGREESTTVIPAVEEAKAAGIDAQGPIPPDTAFLPARREAVDAYVAMYHDQGLIPFKMLSFESGVNITLGLPIVRTSPDHGTAFDIAWRGKASPSSMKSAVRWAISLSACRAATG